MKRTEDNHSELRDAYARGMPIESIAALSPSKTFGDVTAPHHALTSRLSEKGEHQFVQEKRRSVKWSKADNELLRKLHADGASLFNMQKHFPTRSISSVRQALYKYKRGNSQDTVNPSLSKKDERQSVQEKRRSVKWSIADKELLRKLRADGASSSGIHKHFPTRSLSSVIHALHYLTKHTTSQEMSTSRCRWSQKDIQYLAESASQGASMFDVAKVLGRSPRAVCDKARQSSVQFASTVGSWSTEETEQVAQMRKDGASFATIGAALGRTCASVRWHWFRPEFRDNRLQRTDQPPSTQFALDDFRTIRSLRDRDTPWSDIGSLFPQYALSSIKQDFWRFMQYRFNSADIRKIESLRRQGKSWKKLSESGDYQFARGAGIYTAYKRSLEDDQHLV